MNEIIEKGIKIAKGTKWLVISDGIVLVVVLVVAGVFYFQFESISNLKTELALSTQTLSGKISNLEAVLATTSQSLAQQLQDQQSRAADFAETIDDISGTVGNLEKLSKTDKELLQKYSRVYFLSDNYVPLSLEKINSEFLDDTTKTMQFHTSALPYLEKMIIAAAGKDIDIKIVSAYRSFGQQSSLKASYLVTYGSGSNQFSADQGYSEHQLGTAVDLTMPDLTADLTISFETSKAFEWLNANAYKYGFVLSYPKNNGYYQYEPWHWRFVGKSLATRLHRDGINFSDMDQRDIDAYLVKIFD
jgi:D-alanyl-D-alanine carboxypeptidase